MSNLARRGRVACRLAEVFQIRLLASTAAGSGRVLGGPSTSGSSATSCGRLAATRRRRRRRRDGNLVGSGRITIGTLNTVLWEGVRGACLSRARPAKVGPAGHRKRQGLRLSARVATIAIEGDYLRRSEGRQGKLLDA